MPRRVTDASRRNDDDSDSDDWRTSTTQRTPKRRAVSTASFYETSDGRNLGAEYKKIDEARLVDTRKRQAKGAYRIFRKQAWLLEHADVMNGHAPGPLTNDDAADALERRLDARSDLEFYGVPNVQNPGRLWSEEVGGEGQRRYVYAHLNAFREVYEAMTSEKRHFYELIREGAPVRPYFDLEFARDDASINGDDLTRRWLAVFAGALEEAFYAPTALFESHRNAALCHGLYDACPDLDEQLRVELDGVSRETALRAAEAASEASRNEPDAAKAAVYDHVAAVARRAATEPFCAISVKDHVLQLDASTSTKFSRHATFCLPDGAAFVDAAALGSFVRRVLASTNDAFVINGESFVDASVYSRNRCFRLCGSSKKTKRAPLVVVGDGRLASEDALPEASLVVPVAAPSRLLGSHESRHDVVTPSEVMASPMAPRPQALAEGSLPSPFPRVDACILAARPGATVRAWRRTPHTLTYHLAKNRFCERIGRPHKSNNIFFVVDLNQAVFRQRCFDEGCRGFVGAPHALSPEAAEEVFDVLATEACADAEKRA
ncbi:unnamed protein product [Pelagomonas calceolata]|uniref:DNA-directed primase/polymerase protein n=1 Tax=Pelagomonas calceolata TaxID=35677 RepID=A0A7S3ZMC8_9STRA|nr:unnamed protein product [Pelagomonas calceolata]